MAGEGEPTEPYKTTKIEIIKICEIVLIKMALFDVDRVTYERRSRGRWGERSEYCELRGQQAGKYKKLKF